MDNVLEANANAIKIIKEVIARSFNVMINYSSRQGVVDRRFQFMFVLPILMSILLPIPFFLIWSYELVNDTNLYEHLANACWNVMNYNGNSVLNHSPSDVKSQYDLQFNVLCFAESKLVSSSERRMFLLLLLSGMVHSSIRRALWKYITLVFKWFIKDEFWRTLWGYIASYFKKSNEDELSRGVQATSPTVIDEQNPVCVTKSNLPWDLKCCVLLGGGMLSFQEYFHFSNRKTGFIVFSVSHTVL